MAEYPGVSISGYNSSPPSDDGAQTTTNAVRWATHLSKLGNPLRTAIEAIDAALSSRFAQTPLYGLTTAEAAAAVTPSDYHYPPGDVRRYGAVGDGSTNDAAALNSAIAACEGAPYPLVFEARKSYAISSALSSTGNITIEGRGATIIPAATTNGLIVSPGANIASTTLAADAQINTNAISVGSATGFVAGRMVAIISDASWHINPDSEALYKGELGIIKSVSGTDIELEDSLFDNYDTGAETVSVYVLTSAEFVCRDLNIVYASPTAAVALQVGNCVGGLIDNCTLDGAQTQDLNLDQCYAFTVMRSRIRRANNASTGYGVQLNSCMKCKIGTNDFLQNRRGVDLSGDFPTRACIVENNTADGSGDDSNGSALTSNSGNSGFGSHETSEGNVFRNNIIRNVRVGVLTRGMHEAVTGNDFESDITFACVVGNRNTGLTVTGNRYNSTLYPLKTLDVVASDDNEQKAPYFVYLSDPTALTTGYWHFANNQFRDLKNAFLSINFTNASQQINNLYCCNNIGNIRGSDATTTVYFIETPSGGQNYTIGESIILDNQVNEDTASLVMYENSVTIDFDTCDFDDYLLPAAHLTESTSGSEANITKDQCLINLSVRHGTVKLVGVVQFDIANATSVVLLQNLPSKLLNGGTYGPPIMQPFIESITTSGVGASGMLASPLGTTGSIPTSIWLSYDRTAYNTGWPVGSNYTVPIHVEYRTVRRLE